MWGYLVILFAHLAVNYSNVLFDREVDKLSDPSLFSGGSKILVFNPEMVHPIRVFSSIMVVLSLVIGIILVGIYDLPLWYLLVLFCGNFLGWFYSAPPLRLSYRGWGEIAATVSLGLLIPATSFFTVARELSKDFFILSLPIVLYAVVFILSVELPDRETDELGNKKTLVTRIGRAASFGIIGLFLFLAWFVYFLMSGFYPFIVVPTWASLAVLFFGLFLVIGGIQNKKQTTCVVTWLVIVLMAVLFVIDCYFIAYVVL
jgi:1,4-dihydroxy-2-naphthoate octaprenyltransferase